jgi:DNA-binding XRE family transcriptional regulator
MPGFAVWPGAPPPGDAPDVTLPPHVTLVDPCHLGELLRARAAVGLTQADVAARIGTTQSAVGRLESADSRPSPSIATLQRYASALGCKLQVWLVRRQDANPGERWNGRKVPAG